MLGVIAPESGGGDHVAEHGKHGNASVLHLVLTKVVESLLVGVH